MVEDFLSNSTISSKIFDYVSFVLEKQHLDLLRAIYVYSATGIIKKNLLVHHIQGVHRCQSAVVNFFYITMCLQWKGNRKNQKKSPKKSVIRKIQSIMRNLIWEIKFEKFKISYFIYQNENEMVYIVYISDNGKKLTDLDQGKLTHHFTCQRRSSYIFS